MRLTGKCILFTACAVAMWQNAAAASNGTSYMVVDLASGAVAYGDGVPSDYTNNVYKTTKMVFRRVPAGTYAVQNGAVQATMTNAYYIGIYEVTVGQYKLMQNPEASVPETAANMKPKSGVSYSTVRGTRYAADEPTAASLAGRLTALVRAGGSSGCLFDLPTEAMWEVAARAMPAGDDSHAAWPWFFGTSASALGDYAWYLGNAGGVVHAVGLKQPNAWGLYDMYGNVLEWCRDHWSWSNFAPTMEGNTTDAGANRSQRGGSFESGGNDCSSGMRMNAYNTTSESIYGFRLAMVTADGSSGEPDIDAMEADCKALEEAFGGNAEVIYDSGSGRWIVSVTNDITGPVVVPDVDAIEINLNGNGIAGPDGDAAGNAAAPDGLPAIVLEGTNTTLSLTGTGTVAGGDGADETSGAGGHAAGNGAPAITVPYGFAGTVTAESGVTVTGGSGGNAADPESAPGSGAVSGVTGDNTPAPDGQPAPARLLGPVQITEWQPLGDTLWHLVFTTPASALKGRVENLEADRSFSLKYSNCVMAFDDNGPVANCGYAAFTIVDASSAGGLVSVTVTLTAANNGLGQPFNLFVKVVDPVCP